MPRSVNRVTLLGHLGKDAELRFTPSGSGVANFSIATSRRWKDKQSSEWKEETEWHNIVYWNAESVSNYLTKGKPVYVEGRLQTRKWEDKQGNARYTTEIVAENLILLGSDMQDAPVSAPRGRPQPMPEAQQNSWGGDAIEDEPPF
jgi:single-strand DNA-binding protein